MYLQRYTNDQQTRENMLSLVIMEIQIKTTMRYHFISPKMAIVKKKKKESKCWEGYKERLVLLLLLLLVRM